MASILTAVSGIGTYLRSGYSQRCKQTLYDMIDRSPIDPRLKSDLHKLLTYRNRWVHVDAPWDDDELLEETDNYELALVEMAIVAARALRRAIHENPWI